VLFRRLVVPHTFPSRWHVRALRFLTLDSGLSTSDCCYGIDVT
jgi:hypothetical protein